MISSELKKAREFEEREGRLISEEERPVFHFSPRTGWLNDPNGFSYHDGKYHLFYQYHPYDSHWGPMHWGHAVSDDLIGWEYLPCAMAPDQPYDGAGCFSGSAITLPDGRQLLMYTGCDAGNTDEDGRWLQTQCLAAGSGTEYIKYEGNPVITGDDLPPGADPFEFRDPYMWRAADGSFRAVVSAGAPEGAKLCVYRSGDGFDWNFSSVLFEDSEKIGVMWECPNFFELNGRHVLIASPMDMELEEADGSVRFPKGNNVCCITGDYDEESGAFTPDRKADGRAVYMPVDMGLDFYAPQVLRTPDGRLIMIGWMQDPSTAMLHDAADFRIFGQMSVPRELSLSEGRLIQRPVRELDAKRGKEAAAADILLDNEKRTVDGISGRVLDLGLKIRPETVSDAGSCSLDEFTVRFAEDEGHCVGLSFRPDSAVLTIDRSMSGQAEDMTKRRSVRVRDRKGCLDLRILLDKYSAEIFINGGEQVMSVTYHPPPEADGIIFEASGRAMIKAEAFFYTS